MDLAYILEYKSLFVLVKIHYLIGRLWY